MFCTDIPDPLFFIFSEYTPHILYYSHLPAALAALVLGVFVVSRSQEPAARILLAIAVFFSLWSVSDLILWTNSDGRMIMFVWSYLNLLQNLISLSVVFFAYAFIERRWIPTSWLIGAFLIFIPSVLLVPTTVNLLGFDQTICEAMEGSLIYYFQAVDIGLFLVLLGFLVYKIFKTQERGRLLTFSIGTLLFLLSFTGMTIIATETGYWELQQYGLLGLPVFLGFVVLHIVQFKRFNIRSSASMILLGVMLVLTFSLLFIQDIGTARIIVSITLMLLTVIGFIFIQATKKEQQQKLEIEHLALKLERANGRLKVLDKMKSEFVSIASHQLRSPLTSIRGYTSMLLEGSYGKLPEKAREAIERISESSRFMASSVEDYLNVSRIQAGNMKYTYTDFNLNDLVHRIADDTRIFAIKKGLLLTCKSDLTKQGIVHADIGKTRQILDNLLNNALKYTPKGSITITVHDNPKRKLIYVDISDTGIGMAPYGIDDMFEKFERAENASVVNVTGTGLGLYIARKIAREMGGEVSARSEGEGKGSTFTLEMRLQM